MILMGVPNCGFCEIGYSVRIRGILWGPGENGLLKCWILSELCCNSTAALFSCVSPSCQSQCILSHLGVRRSRTRCRRLQRKFGPRRMGRVGLSWISQLWEKALGFFSPSFLPFRWSIGNHWDRHLIFQVTKPGNVPVFHVALVPANEPHSKRRGKLNGENGD